MTQLKLAALHDEIKDVDLDGEIKRQSDLIAKAITDEKLLFVEEFQEISKILTDSTAEDSTLITAREGLLSELAKLKKDVEKKQTALKQKHDPVDAAFAKLLEDFDQPEAKQIAQRREQLRNQIRNREKAQQRKEDAEKAFESISSAGRSPLIVLLEYEKEPAREKSVINDRHKPKKKKISLGIIGAGGFVNDVHLSNLVKLERLFDITAICSKRGSNAASIAEQYNAVYSTTDYKRILSDDKIDAVLIATRHDLHAAIAGEAATAGKAVFVEKPMALEEKELRDLVKILNTKNTCYMIGFNRRFSPFSVKAKEMIDQRTGPVIINYRVNAGFIPPESWVHSSEGGGRNIGEACHFYDLFDYFTGYKAVDIQAMGADHGSDLFRANENFAVLIKFEDSSVCNLVYTAMGNEGVPKEQIDIYFDRKIIQINDFKELRFHGINEKDIISGNQEKGHFEEIKSFGNCLKNNQDPIPLWQLVQATEISFEVERQLSER